MSNMKCPFCQQELDTGNYYVHCHNPHCDITEEMEGTEEMWEALIRTRKALELALAELQEIDGCCEDNKYTDNLYVGLDGQDTRNIALDVKKTIAEIKTALEQKDEK